MDGGTWWATIHGVAKSQARLTDFTFTLTCIQITDAKEIGQHSFQFSSLKFTSVQFSSVAQSCLTLCDPMDYSPWSSSGQNRGMGSFSPSPADLPNLGIKPGSPALQADYLPTELSGYSAKKLNKQGDNTALTYSFPGFEPVHFSWLLFCLVHTCHYCHPDCSEIPD